MKMSTMLSIDHCHLYLIAIHYNIIYNNIYNCAMSSIISDLFYGSKRNILDNYLVNRQDYQ